MIGQNFWLSANSLNKNLGNNVVCMFNITYCMLSILMHFNR